MLMLSHRPYKVIASKVRQVLFLVAVCLAAITPAQGPHVSLAALPPAQVQHVSLGDLTGKYAKFRAEITGLSDTCREEYVYPLKTPVMTQTNEYQTRFSKGVLNCLRNLV